MPTIEWHHARSLGLPYGGSLIDGTQLPIKGPDWVTWDPITDSVPNLPHRLYGNEHTIRAIVKVARAYRGAHPHDVDVYFPRRDHRLRAPTTTRQIDRRLAQDLLDRFVAAGAQYVFVGYSTGLRGRSEVVVPWPGHEYHMHVRFRRPG